MVALSGCADFERRRTREREKGNTLAILLGAVVILGLIGGALFEIANGSRQRALQTQYRDRAVGGAEFDLEAIRLLVSQQFQEQAWVDVASLSINQAQTQGSLETGLYNLDVQAKAEGPQILATQTHNTTLQALTATDDPFRGLAAVVDTVTVTAHAQSMLSTSSENRFSLPSLALNPQLSVRQIPASEFTLFSASPSSFQVTPTAMPILGRVHAEGDLVISGGPLTSIYPVTAGGNISLANNGALFAQSGPDEPASTFPVQSTADNNWLAMSRSVEHSTILSGRDLPMNTFEAADVIQMTMPALASPPTTPAAQQQLWRQCNRIITEHIGQITATTSAGAQCTPQEKRAFYTYYSRHNPDGVAIVFDLSRVPPQAGRNSFYFASSSPNRMVLIINARKLTADLAIVTPLPVAIEGGLNVLGDPKAVSITAENVFGVPTGW
jgi:hypothetical protein